MPGPGAFNPSDNLYHDMRSTKFGSSKRYELSGGGEGPGPGTYSFYDRNIGTAPAYSMKGRYGKEKGSGVPGPGQYNPSVDAAKESISAGRFGTG